MRTVVTPNGLVLAFGIGISVTFYSCYGLLYHKWIIRQLNSTVELRFYKCFWKLLCVTYWPRFVTALL